MTTAPDGDGRDRPEGRPAGPGFEGALPADLVVPDDASSLELDRLALARERALARRRARWERIFLTKRFHRYGISGPIVSLCLLVVFIFAALLALVVPSGGNPRLAQAPLAVTSAPAGTVGSLLPEVTLKGVGRIRQDRDARSLRPGVVLLLPAGCTVTQSGADACADAIRSITATARDYNLLTWAVAGPAVTNLVALADAPASADTYAIPLQDPTGAVLRAFPMTALPTAVLISPAGQVEKVIPDADQDTAVTPAFDRLTGRA